MKDFSIVVLVIFLGLLMTCCYMLALVNAENTQSQQQQHISVLWVTMQSNLITSSSPVKQRLPNSVWNRNVWYSWVQVMIWWPRWHMLNTHTHTQTLQSLDSPTVSTHHRSSCRDFLRQAKLLGKTWKERERYRGKERERDRLLCMISRNEFTFYDCSKEKNNRFWSSVKFPLNWRFMRWLIWLALFILQR